MKDTRDHASVDANAGDGQSVDANPGDAGSTDASSSPRYYNQYSCVATLGNANSCGAAEGFAVGSTYVYSAKINSDETKQIVYRTKMSDGSTTLMTNGDNGTSYATYLGHANDLVLSTIDGVTYMFVVTLRADSLGLVKLKYSGSTFYKVGNYTIRHNGVAAAMSGVKITSKDASTIHFLLKSGRTYFRGTLPLTANSGTIDVTDGFVLDIAHAKVNGSTISNIGDYTFQGFGYDQDSIFVPLTYNNISIVLVYRNISTASGTIESDPDLSFRVTSSAFPNKFEIESVGIDGTHGWLWFSANRKTTATDTSHDAVCYFDGYSAG